MWEAVRGSARSHRSQDASDQPPRRQQGRRRRQLQAGYRQEPRHRRRVGQRQIDDRAFDPAAGATALRQDRGRLDPLRWAGPARRNPSARCGAIRGGSIAIILQDPIASLNPVFSIGFQIAESVRIHQHLSGEAQLARVVDSLRRVRVPTPEVRVQDYPHQFSGGMRQRVVGAIAIACQPKLLIADEATTALDTTIQAQYLDLLRTLQRELNLALLFITHDFGIVARMCDDVAVMYAGRIVEHAEVREIFNRPAHPYTMALLEAVPKVDARVDRLHAIPGQPSSGYVEQPGCPFAPRCTLAIAQCHVAKPPLTIVKPGHTSECWRAQEVYAAGIGRQSGATAAARVGA